MSVELFSRATDASCRVRQDARAGIQLYRLYQTHAYESEPCGRPDAGLNRRIILQALAFARDGLKFRGNAQLLPVKSARMSGDDAHPRLPDILCIGEFICGEPVRDAASTCSSVTLVWFQHRFAPPIAEDVLAELHELDWRPIAEDWRL
jgi:hypothetical protein